MSPSRIREMEYVQHIISSGALISDSTPTASHPLFHLPVLGWIARDLNRDFHGNIWYAVMIFLTALVLAVKTWGLVALGLTALSLVPVMFVILILLTVGK